MKLDVPFFSQFASDVPMEWQPRSCGIVSVRMALAIPLLQAGRELPTTEHLIREAEAISGWTQYGLNHETIIRLAHNYGVPAYNEEFRSISVDIDTRTFSPSSHVDTLLEIGIGRIRAALKNGHVVLASVPRGLKLGGSFHLITIIGYEEGEHAGFYYHDPEYTDANEGAAQFVDDETFRQVWRRLMTVIG